MPRCEEEAMTDNGVFVLMAISMMIGIVVGLALPYIGNEQVAMPSITQPNNYQCECALWCHHEEYCNGDSKCNAVWNASCNTHCKGEIP
jgi:hypothetical protein